nr:unnamed protein product [Callosobruchus chinensis]
MCNCNNNIYTYEKLSEIKDFLREKVKIEPKIGIICGSGLGSLGNAIDDAVPIDYADIPDFPVSTVEGHVGRFIFGHIRGTPVACMQGRFHYYEGYPLSICAMPVRLMKLLGVSYLIASNAAGGLNSNYKVGDIMLQKDHFNIMGLAGLGPHIGPNDSRFGPRFFSMTNSYDEVVQGLNMENRVHEGVYTCVGGPNYETVADVRALINLGVDAVGMSTVHEVIAARQCGISIEVHSEEVLKVGKDMEDELRIFVEEIVEAISQDKYTFETLTQTANYLKKHVPFTPKIGIICGSGLGSLADSVENKIEIPYEKIPHFPRSTVKGHVGELVFGYLSNVPVVCMRGRFHYYEGYPLWKCAMPVRVMKLLGVEHLIVTNAAGGLNSNYKVGDIMLVKDHINLMGFAGNNPLQGPNDERFEKNIHEGVYTCLGGPNFETVAELKMLKMLGADTVGMSTVHEVITARHCNLNVFAFSLITNMCVIDYDCEEDPNHEEVIDVGKMREDVLKNFVKRVVKNLAETHYKEE